VIRKAFIKLRSAVLFILIGGVIILTGATGFLYRQNKLYQKKNRELILKNDSVLSVNIELMNALQQRPVKKPSVSLKVP